MMSPISQLFLAFDPIPHSLVGFASRELVVVGSIGALGIGTEVDKRVTVVIDAVATLGRQHGVSVKVVALRGYPSGPARDTYVGTAIGGSWPGEGWVVRTSPPPV